MYCVFCFVIDILIQNTLRCSATLQVLMFKLLARKTIIWLYKSILRPILFYGCKAKTFSGWKEDIWPDSKGGLKLKDKEERGGWKVFDGTVIMGKAKAQRLRWTEHLERMGADRGVKKANPNTAVKTPWRRTCASFKQPIGTQQRRTAKDGILSPRRLRPTSGRCASEVSTCVFSCFVTFSL